jgi:hypothetical protein
MNHHPECTTKSLNDTKDIYLWCHDDCPVLAELLKRSREMIKGRETLVYS